jgi:hypothetical protein
VHAAIESSFGGMRRRLDDEDFTRLMDLADEGVSNSDVSAYHRDRASHIVDNVMVSWIVDWSTLLDKD